MSNILKGLQLNELSNKKLGDYKTAAGADATAADKAGDYKRGDKRMSGIIKATKKEFANDEKKKDVTESVAETLPMDDAMKVLRQYGADHFKTTSNELHFYKNGRPLSVDLIWGNEGERSVNLSQLNSATRQLKGQGVAEAGMPFRGVGGAFNRGDDERHDLDPSEWYIVKDGKMYKTSVYPNQVQQAIAQGYSRSREEAKAKADRQGVAEGSDNQEIGQQMANDGVTYSPAKENEIINLMAQYMQKAGMSSKQIRYLLSYDEDYVGDQLSFLPRQKVTEDQLDELKCWSGYHRVAGTKAGFPGSCAKNKTNEEGVAEGSEEDMSKEVKAMATGTCPHCHGPVKKKEHPTLTQYHCAKCGIRGSIDKQGVAEGSSDTVYPNAEVIKSKNGKPVGEIYQDGNSWGAFHYRADRGYDLIDSREDAIEALRDLHQETGRSRPDYTIKGVAEATGDEKFDKMIKGITGKKAVAKQQKIDTKQQARDAFGGMFGGGNPADKLGIRKKGVAEMDKSQTPPGRDGSNDPDAGKKEYTAKVTTPEKIAKHGKEILNKVLNKKQGVAEATGDAKFDTMMGNIAKPSAVKALGREEKVYELIRKYFWHKRRADLGSAVTSEHGHDRMVQKVLMALKKMNVDLSTMDPSKLKAIKGEVYEQGVAEGSKEDMSKEVKAMATGTCPHCHGPVKKKEHPTLTQYHCPKCGIRASQDKQGVAEGSTFPGPLSGREWSKVGRQIKSSQGRDSSVTSPHQRKDWYNPKDPRSSKQQKLDYLKSMKAKQGVAEEQHSCPHCGGEMVSEELMNEKKDACYYKVKSRYKVWPSAYASGALVKCRKSGADSWGDGGKKNESSILEGIEQVDENLHKWFKEKWVRFGPDGKIRGDCARGDDSEGKPKCLPQSKAQNLGKEGRASAAARKRREDPNPERSGKAINVNTKKKSNEGVAEGLDKPREAGKAIQSLKNLAIMKSALTMQQLSQAGRESIVTNAINAAKTLEQSYMANKQQGNAIFVRALRDEIDNFRRGAPINASFPESDNASELGDLLQGKLSKINFQQDMAEAQLDEKWSTKYKDSINCSNPKGFSQKAHCQGKNK